MGIEGPLPRTEPLHGKPVTPASLLDSDGAAADRSKHGSFAANHPPCGVWWRQINHRGRLAHVRMETIISVAYPAQASTFPVSDSKAIRSARFIRFESREMPKCREQIYANMVNQTIACPPILELGSCFITITFNQQNSSTARFTNRPAKRRRRRRCSPLLSAGSGPRRRRDDCCPVALRPGKIAGWGSWIRTNTGGVRVGYNSHFLQDSYHQVANRRR